jgi:hypothetical protein
MIISRVMTIASGTAATGVITTATAATADN